MNIVPSALHPMLTGRRLCWLNSSLQLVLADNLLINSMSQYSFFKSLTTNINMNTEAFAFGTEDDLFTVSDLNSKIDEITIKYLCDILQSLPKKLVEEHLVQEYIKALQDHGPKSYCPKEKNYLPLIRSFGELSCIDIYLRDVLVKSVSNFLDTRIIWEKSLTCQQCHAHNISNTDHQSLLSLFTFYCEGSSLPDAALEYFFLAEGMSSFSTCSRCGDASEQNRSRKEIVQLPGALFLSFIRNKAKTTDVQVKPIDFFIQNHLDISSFASPQLVCYPSYFRYQLKSMIISVGDTDDNRHYYTLAKYGEHFYRCDDKLIEPVDSFVVFKRKYSISSAMYIREKVNHVNFIEIIHQILFNEKIFVSPTSASNTHVSMMFNAALEHVARGSRTLCWSYGAIYPCLECKENNQLFGADCLLFSNETHVSKDSEISLDNTLLQTKLVPKMQCKKQCSEDLIGMKARYRVLEIPQFVFVTVAHKSLRKEATAPRTTAGKVDKDQQRLHEQIHINCHLQNSCFTYNLSCFIVVTKDERTMIVKPMGTNQYKVYNNDKRSYEPLASFQFDDFIQAAATNIILCYETYEKTHLIPIFKPSMLNMDEWVLPSTQDLKQLMEKINRYMSNFIAPLKIGPYRLESTNILQLLEPTSKINDQQFSAHLYTTTALLNATILFDSIAFVNYHRRGFKKSSEFLDQRWFSRNIVLVPVHHSQHWFLFVIDIEKKIILLFDSLPLPSTPHQDYLETIIQLLRIHYFYTEKSNLHFDDWSIIKEFSQFKQDDPDSCGLHCALFARSYVTSTKYPPINTTNMRINRARFALHLLQYRNK